MAFVAYRANDRPKSVLNRCVIEVCGGVFVLSIGFRIFCWCKDFCHRTDSDLLVFLLQIVLYRKCSTTSDQCWHQFYDFHTELDLY